MSYLDRARELLSLLRVEESRAKGEETARELERRTASGEEKELLVRRVAVEGVGELRVLTLPSIFAPEEWGRTFLRGLLARPGESYRGKTVVELGTGSGWVAVALAKATAVARIHALDLNPQAAVVTEINARLNGVAEKIVPGVSDLLSALEGVTVDLVCGNIPQVLGADELARAEELLRPGSGHEEDAPADVLRMLADYTPPTGNYEDVLSLGLIASALERTLEHLAPGGRIVLNLAGRPGFDVIRWVFARWGYAPRVVWKDRIEQDPTTDISPFARAEEKTGRAFSFFAARDAKERITASEALARRGRGEPVFHDLYVVEGRPYRQLADEGARRWLEETKRIPYTEDPGSELEALRAELAVYLSCYLRLAAEPGEIFLAPSFEDLETALRLATPALRKAALGTRERPDALGAEGVRALLAGAGTLLLDATFAPIASLRREPSAREELLSDLWRREDAVLWLDLGVHLRTEEQPLVAALVGPRWRTVQVTAEATYSRAPTVPQAALLSLLATINERYRGPRAEWHEAPAPLQAAETPLSRELALLPALQDAPRVPRRIRLDFGESEFPVPEKLREGVLRGIKERDLAALERGAREGAARYLSGTRGVPVEPDEVVLGAGAQGLLRAAILGARSLGDGRTPLVLLPRPFYGLFPAIILAAGGEIAPVSASFVGEKPPFELALDEDEIRFRARRAEGRGTVLLLANPNNPTGLYVHALDRVLGVAEELGAVSVVDEVFHTLAHTRSGASAVGSTRRRVLVVEGLSKSFAAGGLRMGFAWTRDRELRSRLAPRPPSRSALGAARALLEGFAPDLEAHVAWLSERAGRTKAVLRELGLDHVEPAAGLFLSADLGPLERRLWTGRDIRGGEPASRPEPEDFRATLAAAAGLVVSPDHWSGWSLPHRRIVFALEELEEALVRLRAFTTVLE
jgi:aspartate/methionine/tyrosine aminotransferase/methylase of polypeptide subunit release factors